MKEFVRILLFLLLPLTTFSQGCSDAGFCTMGAMKPDQPYNNRIAVRLRSMEMSFYRGTTTLTPIIFVATADLNFSLNRKNTFQLKLPYQAVDGRLAQTSGMGDISICFTRQVVNADRFSINASLGGKILTNHSDKTSADGRPLPMYYQTSLGTYDVISGISLISRKWLLATGIQVPLNQNGNQFVWSAWDGSENEEYANHYNQAMNLHRGIDVMFRAERNFRFAKFNASVGVLPIYRVNRDVFTRSLTGDASSALKRVSPPEAMGLAASAIATAGYSFDVRNSIKLLVGHKIRQRDVNPDGLTRELVTSFTYAYRF
jgi:hypothetical protein